MLRACRRRAHRALSARYLPFADAATADVPLGRLVRLSLFQLSVGMVQTLLSGTLNRVMIVELQRAGVAGGAVASPSRCSSRRSARSSASAPTRTARCSAGGACRSSGWARCCSSAGWRSCRSRCSCSPATAAPGARRPATSAGARVPARRRRRAHHADRRARARHRPRARAAAAARDRAHVPHACCSATWSSALRARRAAARLHAASELIQVVQGARALTVVLNSWRSGSRRRACAGTEPYAPRRAPRRCSARRGACSPPAAARCGCWSRWRSASSRSTCRTCCSSPTAARSCA